MRNTIAWALSRTCGIGLLALFTTTHQASPANAACQGCQSNCWIDELNTVHCTWACVSILNGPGAAGCSVNAGGGCAFTGWCQS